MDRIRTNLAIVSQVLEEEHLRPFIETLKALIYPRIHTYITQAHTVLQLQLRIPTLTYSLETACTKFAQKQNDPSFWDPPDLMDWVEKLIGDIEYLQAMMELEEKPIEGLGHIVPVSGLVLGCFLRVENELRTVLEVWSEDGLAGEQAVHSTNSQIFQSRKTLTASEGYRGSISTEELLNGTGKKGEKAKRSFPRVKPADDKRRHLSPKKRKEDTPPMTPQAVEVSMTKAAAPDAAAATEMAHAIEMPQSPGMFRERMKRATPKAEFVDVGRAEPDEGTEENSFDDRETTASRERHEESRREKKPRSKIVVTEHELEAESEQEEAKKESPKVAKEIKEVKDKGKQNKEPKEAKEVKEAKETKEVKEVKEVKETKEKESRGSNETKEQESKGSKDETKEKESRDSVKERAKSSKELTKSAEPKRTPEKERKASGEIPPVQMKISKRRPKTSRTRGSEEEEEVRPDEQRRRSRTQASEDEEPILGESEKEKEKEKKKKKGDSGDRRPTRSNTSMNLVKGTKYKSVTLGRGGKTKRRQHRADSL